MTNFNVTFRKTEFLSRLKIGDEVQFDHKDRNYRVMKIKNQADFVSLVLKEL